MSENVSLSAKQEKFLAALLAGNTIVVAAKVAGVSEQTGHRWLKDSTFSEAYKQAKNKLFEDALDEMKGGMGEAVNARRKHLNADVEPTPTTQMGAIRLWVEQSVTLHKVSDLEAK